MKEKFLLMLLAIALVAGAAQANMLTNSSFEDGAFGYNVSPDDWTHYYTESIAQHTWVSNTAEAHSGSKYMKMYNWFKSYLTWSTSAYLGQDVDVKEGKDYYFSVWAKNGAAGQVNEAAVEVEWRDSLDNWISSDSAYILFTDSDWTEVDFGAFTAPVGAATAILWLIAPVGNYINPIWYDDVSMLGPDPNVHAGPDMISWDGETVSLTGSEDFPGDPVTITWSADPNYCAVITGGDTLTPTVQVNPIIESGPATIVNHSFENGLTGWATASGEGHGTWNGTGADPVDANYLKVYVTPTDGRMCAYVVGSDSTGQINQTLVNNLLAANTTYTLMVDVVNDGYYEEDVAYRVQLRAGTGAPLAQDNDSHALDTYGVWETSTVTFGPVTTHAKLGEPLEIRLAAKLGTNEMTFDNVRLTANPPFPAYVPDVLPITLTLDIDGDKYDTMKIDVYPDGCAAKMGAGLRETTDLVGDDCITNLPDFTEMAKTWFDHNALTEPKAEEQSQGSAGLGEVFSLNFYMYPWPWTDPDNPAWKETITLNTNPGDMDQSAGYDTWLTDSWMDINIPWNPPGPQDPVTITSNQGSEATYTLNMARNGGAYFWPEPRTTLLDDGNADMMDGHVNGTEDQDSGTPSLPDEIGDITISDIPFPVYDAIFYIGSQEAQFFDGTGKFVFNDVEQDFTLPSGVFDGTFTEITNGTTPGNYIVFNGLTDSSFNVKVWGNGFNHIGLCGLQFGSADKFNPTPADRTYVYPVSDLELSWTNIALDPNDPNDPGAANPIESVYVDVWFGTGTEPNELDPNSEWVYDLTRIVDAVEDANSATVDVLTPIPETYYWQVNSYIYGNPAVVDYDVYGTDANLLPVDEGRLLSFTVVNDFPVSVEAGGNVVTWSGQAVQLDASFDDDGVPALTWTANPADGLVFSATDVEDPCVTITKDPGVAKLLIINAGFEDPPYDDGGYEYDLPSPWKDGWYWGSDPWVDEVYYAGIENPDTAYGGIVPEGQNAAFQYSYGGYDMGLRQILATTLEPDTHYELSVMVGNPDAVASNDYLVELLAGGVVLNSSTGASPDPDTWTATPVTVTYDSPSLINAGQALEIRLVMVDDGSTDQLLNFDDVRLTATGSALPTTVTLTLSADDGVNSDEDTIRIDVYDTACLAAIGLGQEYDPGDFDTDCDTDLEDLAAIAEEWLVYIELTESIVKP